MGLSEQPKGDPRKGCPYSIEEAEGALHQLGDQYHRELYGWLVEEHKKLKCGLMENPRTLPSVGMAMHPNFLAKGARMCEQPKLTKGVSLCESCEHEGDPTCGEDNTGASESVTSCMHWVTCKD